VRRCNGRTKAGNGSFEQVVQVFEACAEPQRTGIEPLRVRPCRPRLWPGHGVQQRLLEQHRRRCARHPRGRGVGGRNHHADLLGSQIMHVPSGWPRGIGQQQDRIQHRLFPGETAVQCRPLQGNPRQRLLQGRQARDHPPRQHAAAAAEHQGGALRGLLQLPHAGLQRVEGLAAGGLQALACRRKAQAATGALEQRNAKMRLQQFELTADRTMGDVKRLRGPAHAAQPGGGLEGAKGIEWRQGGGGHVSFTDG